MSSNSEINYTVNLEGTKPVTDEPSKKVMITAERRDKIHLTEIVARYSDDVAIPDKYSVIERISRYHGDDLMLYAEVDHESENYVLNAPGPGSYLHLWKAIKDSMNRRKSFVLAAEVKAQLQDGSYKMCPDCGEPFKTRKHERLARIGRCPNVE